MTNTPIFDHPAIQLLFCAQARRSGRIRSCNSAASKAETLAGCSNSCICTKPLFSSSPADSNQGRQRRFGRARFVGLKDGLKLILAGLALGTELAVFLGRAMSSLLYGVKPLDPVARLGVVVVVLATSIAALVAPASTT